MNHSALPGAALRFADIGDFFERNAPAVIRPHEAASALGISAQLTILAPAAVVSGKPRNLTIMGVLTGET